MPRGRKKKVQEELKENKFVASDFIPKDISSISIDDSTTDDSTTVVTLKEKICSHCGAKLGTEKCIQYFCSENCKLSYKK